jgi:DNA-binding CsgD family transcriptional regulator
MERKKTLKTGEETPSFLLFVDPYEARGILLRSQITLVRKIINGKSKKEIANDLGIARHTLQNTLHNLYGKLNDYKHKREEIVMPSIETLDVSSASTMVFYLLSIGVITQFPIKDNALE